MQIISVFQFDQNLVILKFSPIYPGQYGKNGCLFNTNSITWTIGVYLTVLYLFVQTLMQRLLPHFILLLIQNTLKMRNTMDIE